MSVDTKLQINSCWEIGDIINVLTSRFELEDIEKERKILYPKKTTKNIMLKLM